MSVYIDIRIETYTCMQILICRHSVYLPDETLTRMSNIRTSLKKTPTCALRLLLLLMPCFHAEEDRVWWFGDTGKSEEDYMALVLLMIEALYEPTYTILPHFLKCWYMRSCQISVINRITIMERWSGMDVRNERHIFG